MKSPGFVPPPYTAAGGGGEGRRRRGRAPTPEDLIAEYESKGFSRDTAAIKVIGELQRAVIRLSGGGKNSVMEECSRKLSGVIGRLAVLEVNIDSKPDFRQAFSIGIASGTFVKGISFAVPPVIHTIGCIFGFVKNGTRSRT